MVKRSKQEDMAGALEQALADGAAIISIDVPDRETLIEAGRLIWELGGDRGFGRGSRGSRRRWLPGGRNGDCCPYPESPPPGAAARIVCVSGLVSPATAGQIAHALAHGFEGIRRDVALTADPVAWENELTRATMTALAAVGNGRDPLVYTATGPDDLAVAALTGVTHTAGLAPEEINERIGSGLGSV